VARNYEERSSDLIEKVVAVGRNAKVVKGGERFSFGALTVVGNGKGKVGLGFGKAKEVTDAINKAMLDAKKNIVSVYLYKTTIPCQVIGKFKAGRVLLRPAQVGTGVIAGSAVRMVLEAVGIKDILSKNMGSNNPGNMAKATLKALLSLQSKEENFKRRGIQLKYAKDEVVEEKANEPAEEIVTE